MTQMDRMEKKLDVIAKALFELADALDPDTRLKVKKQLRELEDEQEDLFQHSP